MVLSPIYCFFIMCVSGKLLYCSIKSFFLFFFLHILVFFSCGCVFAFSNVGIRGWGCVCWREGVGGGWEREREISDSLIKDVSKTLIKIEYPCKCKATCNLQVFHLEQLSQCEAVFYVFLHCTQIAILLSLYFSHFHTCHCLCQTSRLLFSPSLDVRHDDKIKSN